MKNSTHPVPIKYHKVFYIGQKDRRGNVIDFKVPPIIIDSEKPISEMRSLVFESHLDINTIPMTHIQPKPFIIIRPSAISHSVFIREEIESAGLTVEHEHELDCFIKFSDVIYDLDNSTTYHWQWRVITLCTHSLGFQDQNKAKALVFEDELDISEYQIKVMDLKKRIRKDLGETPVLIREHNKPAIALGIHHLHAPDFDRIGLEYNALMHCVNKTSIFS